MCMWMGVLYRNPADIELATRQSDSGGLTHGAQAEDTPKMSGF